LKEGKNIFGNLKGQSTTWGKDGEFPFPPFTSESKPAPISGPGITDLEEILRRLEMLWKGRISKDYLNCLISEH
jgi:hypothetical protein